MASSFADLLRAMIQESQNNIRQLRQYTGQPFETHALGHTMNDVLHAEVLRLDMLQTAYSEITQIPEYQRFVG